MQQTSQENNGFSKAGLMKFSGGEFVGSLHSVRLSVLNFTITKNLPVQEMKNVKHITLEC